MVEINIQYVCDIISANDSHFNDILSLNIEEYWDTKDSWEKSTPLERYEIGMWWADMSILKWHHKLLTFTGGDILLLYKNGDLVAEIDFSHTYDRVNGERLHVIWILVSLEYRRQGYAQKLLKYISTQYKLPIWIEPEDHRSASLYQKLGKIVQYYNNFSYFDPIGSEITQQNNNWNHPLIKLDINTNYNSLFTRIRSNELILVVGNYYTPELDLYQLSNPDPNNFILGNLPQPDIYSYHTSNYEIHAIITQYPRIYVNQLVFDDDFEVIIKDIINKIILSGFESVSVQMYDSELVNYLTGLNSNIEIVKDQIYQLHNL